MFLKRQTRYDLMDSYQIEGELTEYPDCLSIDLDLFNHKRSPVEVLVKSNAVIRPDLFFFGNMNTNNLEDIVLWLNNIPSRRDLKAGDILQLPVLGDLESFYLANRKIN